MQSDDTKSQTVPRRMILTPWPLRMAETSLLCVVTEGLFCYMLNPTQKNGLK